MEAHVCAPSPAMDRLEQRGGRDRGDGVGGVKGVGSQVGLPHGQDAGGRREGDGASGRGHAGRAEALSGASAGQEEARGHMLSSEHQRPLGGLPGVARKAFQRQEPPERVRTASDK